MRLLLIEDSPRLQRSLNSAFRRAGYAVDVTGDGEEGLWLAVANDYDTIILDIMLPRLDGLALLERLRARESRLMSCCSPPGIPLRTVFAGCVKALTTISSSHSPLDELLARVEALCRRSYGTKRTRIILDELAIDTGARSVTLAGSPVDLTPREYALLEYLVLRKGEVVSRTEIEHHIYNDSADPLSNVVDSAICMLRKKLTPSGAKPLIRTRRGHGYVLESSAA
jgi:DNA-binding response OmpR family regulator